MKEPRVIQGVPRIPAGKARRKPIPSMLGPNVPLPMPQLNILMIPFTLIFTTTRPLRGILPINPPPLRLFTAYVILATEFSGVRMFRFLLCMSHLSSG